ncbi:diacylglycerol kinase [Peptoniphilus sp. GNH]|nr:diacylglycerol kinase [Peptoniphilus sp. GNH]
MKKGGFISSFNFAIQGIISSLKTERNMKFHYLSALVVIFISLFFKISKTEFLQMTFAITLVLSLELVNTAIERSIDLFTQEYNPIAKLAKDVAAGAVLIAAVNAIFTGYLIFYDKLSNIGFWLLHRVRNSDMHMTFVALFLSVFLTFAGKLLLAKKSGGSYLQGGGVSGHSAVSFCIATIISLLSANGMITLGSFFLAVLVAESRIEGKIHRPIETFLGAIVGILVAIFIFKVVG